jgi:hypothetical protein
MTPDIKDLDPDGDLKRFSKPDLVRAAQEAIKEEHLTGDKIKRLIREGTNEDWYLREQCERLAKEVDDWRSQAQKAGAAVDNLASTAEYCSARVTTLESELDGERRSNEMEIGRLNGIIEGLRERVGR